MIKLNKGKFKYTVNTFYNRKYLFKIVSLKSDIKVEKWLFTN